MPDEAAIQARLESAEHALAQLVDARPNDPDLMGKADALRREFEADAGPHLALVRERFNCILASLGLIPSDSEGQPCHASASSRRDAN